MQGRLDFADLVTDRHVKLQFLERLVKYTAVSVKENISYHFAIAQKLGILLTTGT